MCWCHILALFLVFPELGCCRGSAVPFRVAPKVSLLGPRFSATLQPFLLRHRSSPLPPLGTTLLRPHPDPCLYDDFSARSYRFPGIIKKSSAERTVLVLELQIINKDMPGVLQKFLVASMVMWMAPIAVLYGFNYNIFPGSSQLSPSSQTLVSGFLAVISVNLVITLYIVMAMKEPAAREPQPDPAFLAEAKASISQPATVGNSDGAQAREKEE